MTKILGPSFAAFELNKPWSFGSSALLSEDDLVFICRILECRRCRLRLIYHRLAARELSSGADTLTCGSLKPRHHFHQLARFIKAINIATKWQNAFRYSGYSFSNILTSSTGYALRASKGRRWTCSEHATDLFHHMFFSADDSVYHLGLHQVRASRPAEWTRLIFPKGQTEFFTKGYSKFEKASYTTHSLRPRNFSLHASDFFSPLSFIFGSISSGDVGSSQSPSSEIADANRRWDAGYGGVESMRTKKRGQKCVSFPKFSPVTSVRHMIVYETANRLLRKDRTWEWHFIDRVREGRTVDDEELEQKDQGSVQPASDLLSCLSFQTDASSEAEPCASFDVRRRKRRRKRRRRCQKGTKSQASPNSLVYFAVDIRQDGSSPSFHLDPSYLDPKCSFLFTTLYSPSTQEAKPSVLSEDFLVSSTVPQET
uniref:Uncharacterized protein n=1 Tax=Mesocestoides corti TaxID=53468 RepID=A0A5K3G0I5_MESCO